MQIALIVLKSGHTTGSPCREMIHTGDEIVAIDGLRVKSAAEINAAIHGSIGAETTITIRGREF